MLINMHPGDSLPSLGPNDNKIDYVHNRGRIAACLFDGPVYRGRLLKKVKPGAKGPLPVRDRNKTSSFRAC
ncbi:MULTISPECIES: hypothetical protein [Streptomyces]|uniref:Uncharacterized protein n=1 Tax=Streptomyces noursei TaxID=1971 RepID=A0A2N8PHX9_STRNR|nr:MULTISPECIES: hypothetical protein [Streptomyces]PNE40586.1 hypothetical protein AOB60_06795 [Streptomyces noursei]